VVHKLIARFYKVKSKPGVMISGHILVNVLKSLSFTNRMYDTPTCSYFPNKRLWICGCI